MSNAWYMLTSLSSNEPIVFARRHRLTNALCPIVCRDKVLSLFPNIMMKTWSQHGIAHGLISPKNFSALL